MRLSDPALERLREIADAPDLAGTRYSIVRALGRGGMGAVYEAEDRELARHVALKVLDAPAPGAQASERLLREARILARLEHPGIVPVHDLLRLPDGRLAYAMKLVRGARLDAHVLGVRGLRERLRLFERICEAVAFAHAQGVIHRDLKPGNVMVGAFGEVLVLDWGVAKILGEPPAAAGGAGSAPRPAAEIPIESRDTLSLPLGGREADTQPGTILGTPGYMAPEQRLGRSELADRRADVYGLGMILRELIDGARDAPSRRLQAIVARCSAENPASRYAGVEELAGDVSRFLDDDAVTAYRESPFEAALRFARRHRGPLLLLATYLVVRLLMLVFAGA